MGLLSRSKASNIHVWTAWKTLWQCNSNDEDSRYCLDPVLSQYLCPQLWPHVNSLPCIFLPISDSCMQATTCYAMLNYIAYLQLAQTLEMRPTSVVILFGSMAWNIDICYLQIYEGLIRSVIPGFYYPWCSIKAHSPSLFWQREFALFMSMMLPACLNRFSRMMASWVSDLEW